MVFVLDFEGPFHGVHGDSVIVVQVHDVLHRGVHEAHQFELRTDNVQPIDLLVRIALWVLEVDGRKLSIVALRICWLDLSDETQRLQGWMPRIVQFGQRFI